jgi:hypothetical protein
MNSKVIELLTPYDGAQLECDGFVRVAHTVLSDHHIAHTPKIGRVEWNGKRFAPHFWIELPGGDVVDYRLRMWFGGQAPHGVFNPEKAGVVYEGRTANIPVLSDFLFTVLSGRSRTAGVEVEDVRWSWMASNKAVDVIKRCEHGLDTQDYDFPVTETELRKLRDYGYLSLDLNEGGSFHEPEVRVLVFTDNSGAYPMTVAGVHRALTHAHYLARRNFELSRESDNEDSDDDEYPEPRIRGRKHAGVLINRGIGKAVVDVNTMTASSENDTKKQIIDRANKIKSAKVKKYVHDDFLHKIEQMEGAAGIWLETVESHFGDLKPKGLMEGWKDADFDDFWFVITGQKRKKASVREQDVCNWRVFRRGAYEFCGQPVSGGKQYCDRHEESARRERMKKGDARRKGSDVILFPGAGDGNDDGDQTHNYRLGRIADRVARTAR